MVVTVEVDGTETVYPDGVLGEMIPGRQQTMGYCRLRGVPYRCVMPWIMEGDYNEPASLLLGKVLHGTAYFVPRS